MYWILATIFIAIALAVPRLRPLGVVGCIVLGTMLGWGMMQRLRGTGPDQARVAERGRPSSPAAAAESVPIKLVIPEDFRLSGGGAPFELRGRIANRADDLQLKAVTIRLTRRDCYEGALDPSGCVKLWQDDHWMAIAVPPREARDFSETIWAHGTAPRPRGTTQDTFEIVAATGEAERSVEKDK